MNVTKKVKLAHIKLPDEVEDGKKLLRFNSFREMKTFELMMNYMRIEGLFEANETIFISNVA